MPVIATADVDIRAKLDNFERDLQTAQARLRNFDASASSSTKSVKDLEESSSLASKAAEAFTAVVSKLSSGLEALHRADAAATNGIKEFVAANDNAQRSSHEAAAANDNHSRSLKEAGKSAVSTASEVLKIAGYVKLLSAVAYVGSPTFKAWADTITGAGKAAANSSINFLGLQGAASKLGTAIGEVKEKVEPLNKVMGAVEIAELAKHFTLASAAAYAASPAFRQVANQEVREGFKALGGSVSLLAPAFRAALSAALPMLTFIARISLPIIALVGTLKLLVSAFQMGQHAVEELDKTLEKTGGLIPLETFEKWSKAAEKLHLNISSLQEALKKFNAVSSEKLGGSDLENQLKELDKAGNKLAKAGLQALSAGNTTEERFRNLVEVLTKAEEKGERLAALQVFEKFLPPELFEKVRAMPDFMQRFVQEADKAKSISIIDEKNLIRANELKTEIDEAYKILNEKFIDVMPILTRLGLELYGIWVKIVEVIAVVVTQIGKFVNTLIVGVQMLISWAAKINDIFDIIDRVLSKLEKQLYQSFKTGFLDPVTEAFTKIGTFIGDMWTKAWESFYNGFAKPIIEAFNTIIDYIAKAISWLSKFGGSASSVAGTLPQSLSEPLKKAGEAVKKVGEGVSEAFKEATFEQMQAKGAEAAAKEQTEALEAAKRKLTRGLLDNTAAQRANREAVEASYKVIKDTSKEVDKLDDAWRKMLANAERHIATMKADAQSVGASAGEHARLRMEMQLTETAEARQIPLTAARIAQIKDLGRRAGEAAQQLAEARVKNQISIEKQTMFMPEGFLMHEAQIAKQLEQIYGDNIPAALRSWYAQQLRIQMNLKDIRDEVLSVGTSIYTTFVGNMRQGMTAAEAWKDAMVKAAQSIIDKLAEMAIKWALMKGMETLFSGLAGGAGGAAAGGGLAAGGAAAATELVSAGATASGALIAGGTEASVALEASGVLVNGALIAGAIEAATALEAAGALVSGAMIAGATEAAIILSSAKMLLPFQEGGIVPGPVGTPVPILAHAGEEIIPVGGLRGTGGTTGVRGGSGDVAGAAGAGAQKAAVLNLTFNANGRISQNEIREHAMTIAQQVAKVFNRNPTVRPKY